MDLVTLEPGLEGLGVMLGELVRGNLEQDPGRARLLGGRPGRINIRAVDAEAEVGIILGGGRIRLQGSLLSRPNLAITTDAETLMALSSVPLRFGLPDVTTAAGREVVVKLLKGQLKVRGMFTQSGLLGRLNKLLSVAP